MAAECVAAGADELLVRAGVAVSLPQMELLGRLGARLPIPLIARVGSAGVDTLAALLAEGVGRVVIEGAALADPDLIARLAGRFGMESVAVAVTARPVAGGWRVIAGRGGAGTEWDAVDWARVIEAQGGGELVLEAADPRAGSIDLDLLAAVTAAVGRPVLATVRADALEDGIDALLIGDADGVVLEGAPDSLAAGVRQLKRLAAEHGLPIRG